MQVGQNKVTDERRFQKRIRAREMNIGDQLPFRIVTGPIHRFLHMWPTQVEDEDTQVVKPTWRSSHVKGDERTVLDQLANLDKALKQKHIAARGGDTAEARSVLAKQDRYDYAIIPRIQGEIQEVTILEANWTVYNDIRNISTLKHPTVQGMLMYGLHYMYDLVLTKGRNPKTGRPSYKVDVLDCHYQGKISINHLDDEKYPIDNPAQFFSAEDLSLIEMATWELEEQDKPIENDKLIEYLKEFPIDLGRQDKTNPSVFLFFNNHEDLAAIQAYSNKENLPVNGPTPTKLGTTPDAAPETPVINAPVNTATLPVTPVIQPVVNQPVVNQPVDVESEVIQETAPVTPISPIPVAAEEVPITNPNGNIASTPPVVTQPVDAPQPETVVQPQTGQPPIIPVTQPANVPNAGQQELEKKKLW